MKSFSIYYENEQDLKNLLNQLDLNKEILIQVFSGIIDKNKIKQIQNFFKPYKNITLIGATTDGEINQKVSTKKIVIAATQFEKTSLKSHLRCLKTINCSSSEKDAAREILNKILTKNTKAIITFATALNINAEEYLKEISKNNILIAGGLAGDNGEFKQTLVFDKENITENGMVAVSLNSDSLIATRKYSLNWISLTKELTITKANKNIVNEIDNKSAVEIYRKYLGDIVADRLPATGIEFPLLTKKDNVTIARAVIRRNGDSLVFAGNLKRGDKVTIGYGNVTDILKGDNEVLNSLSQNPIETIFIYSCMARRRFLGKNIDIEIAPFTKLAPTFGFFTYGEFYNQNFLNETMTILALSEDENKKPPKTEIEIKYNDQITTLSALTHLIKETLKELTHLNKNLTNLVKEKTKKILQKNKELEYQFFHDFLTHLPNKHAFDKDAKDFKIAILVDIVKFSAINEIYTEEFGDKVLLKIASYLRHIAKTYNINLYKVDADKFIFLLNEDIPLEKEIKPQNLEIDNIKVYIDFKIAKSKTKPFKTTAELALKQIKNSNQNFIEYSKDLKLEEKIENDIKIIKEVANAIKEDRIVPFFQKIEKTPIESYECLVRLKKGDEFLPPARFLEIIEYTPYYFDITKIMIEKCCKYFSDKPYNFSLNFSYKDINNPEILNFLFEKIEEFEVQNNIIIEILESESIKDYEKVRSFIKNLKSHDIQVSIDDFGSGHSNFIMLKELNPDYIKIDGELIKNLDTDTKSLKIVESIVDLAKKLDIKIIAEYVRSKEIKEILENLKIDGYQGFFIEKPKSSID